MSAKYSYCIPPNARVFEWDEAKSQDNLEKRGFDFEYAVRIFKGGDLLEYEDRRRHYTFTVASLF